MEYYNTGIYNTPLAADPLLGEKEYAYQCKADKHYRGSVLSN